MAVTVQQVRRYCTASEIELIAMSMPRRVGELPPARLRQKLVRARKLRDKFRDLGDRQQREMRGKSEPRSKRGAESNDATRLKQQAFMETIARFEAALEKAEAKAAKKTASKKASKKTAKKTGKKVGKKAGKKVAKKAGKKRTAKNQGGQSLSATEATARKRASKKKAAKKAGSKARAKKKISPKAASLMAISEPMTRLGVVPEESRALRVEKAIHRGGKRRIDAHVSSRDRRHQAARDAR